MFNLELNKRNGKEKYASTGGFFKITNVVVYILKMSLSYLWGLKEAEALCECCIAGTIGVPGSAGRSVEVTAPSVMSKKLT